MNLGSQSSFKQWPETAYWPKPNSLEEISRPNKFGWLECSQAGGPVISYISGYQVLRAGLHGGHHREGIPETHVPVDFRERVLYNLPADIGIEA